jgi:cell division protein FtsZ
MRQADDGIEALQKMVDTLIIIPNQNLFRIANERTTFAEAFMMADDVLYQGVKGVTDLMVRPGLINLDFADVRSVMDEMGKAMMGTGEAAGETRAIDAAEKAIANPLLDEVSLKGARGVLINITGGYDLTLFELDEAANRIRAEVDPDANIIVGSTLDPDMEGAMRVSVVATGIDAAIAAAAREEQQAAAARAMAAPARPAPASRPAPAPAVARSQEPETARAPEPQPRREAPAANLFADDDADSLAPAAIFDIDDGSLARRPAARHEPAEENPFVAEAQPIPAPRVAEARSEQRPNPRVIEPAHAEDKPARFGFNNLIGRMTGAAAAPKEQPSFIARPGAVRREPAPAPRVERDEEEMRMEIPAFLRRQAN